MEISIYEPVDLIITLMKTTINGMTDRIRRLRQESFDTQPSLSIERALIETEFYKENEGKYPIPILRALNFLEICKQKTIYIGEDELIVGERGPRPKAVSTFPELTCHSVEDLHVLNTRELQRYTISQEDIDTYEREVIPYWKGRTQRERIFNHVPKEWKEAYEAGMFTEFMEQRAPGHFCRTPCRTGRKDGWTRNRPETQRGTEKNSGNLPMGSCTCPPYLLGGHTNVLVCPSRHHYRAERMGRHESRTF